MKIITLIILLSIPFQAAQAQRFRVDKIKGNKAIVDFSGSSLTAGRTYDLGGSSTSTMSSGGGSKDHIIGFAASLANLSASTGGASSSTTNLSIAGRYGWNKINTEYGFIGIFESITPESGSSTSRVGAGGFFDYNFSPNGAGAEMVYGVGGQGTVGSISSSSKSYMYWEVFPSGYLKWFLLKTTTCFRGDLGLYYRNASSDPASTTSGLKAVIELAHYF